MARLPIEAARERVAEITSEARVLGPDVNPCMCGAGRHEHSGPTAQGKCERTGCKRYRRDLVDMLVERALIADKRGLADDLRIADRKHSVKRGKRKTEGSVRVSASDASSCRRAVQYREAPPEDFYRSPDDKRAAFMGTLIHDGAMRVRKALYPWRDFEQPVVVDGLGTSQYDEYDPIMAVLNDVKTAGDWKWDQVGVFGPPESEWEQVSIYALSKVRAGSPVSTIRITYVQRAQGKDEVFERPYDEAYALRAVAKLVTLATGIELGIEQPRDEPGPGLSALCSRFCFARDYCWQIPQAEAAGRSPVSWTRLGPTPEEAEIAWVLRSYVEAREAEKAGKKGKDESKALLEGIEHGEYDEMVYGETVQWRKDDAGYLNMVIAWASIPEAERPPLDSLEMPKKRVPYTKIDPIRKAERDKRAKARAQAEALREQAIEGADGIIDAEVVHDTAVDGEQAQIEAAS